MSATHDRLSSGPLRQYFGTQLTPMSFEGWLQLIADRVDTAQRGHLSGHHNLHSLYLLRTNAIVRNFYARCNDCYIDGMAVRLPLAGAGVATAHNQRFSLMDTFPALLERARQQCWKIFYLGSEQAVIEKARERLAREFPGLHMELHQGYFEDDRQLIEKINTLRPDLLLVGMGMPRQESWLLQHIDQLDVVVAAQAGATLDYFAGAQPKPPGWMSSLGLAWLYRLFCNPRRLWRRYLVEPWSLVVPTLKLWFGFRSTYPTKTGGGQ
jgi:N-acetylglucosaminyldiphosphoundecaprenol N-acetyl-beta-D-mannosaminyltransferase